ncbi:MAG: acetylornithine/succinylornithine family transaminase [Phycisphaeraceae bacterium]|nr:acetylornithine/succinylornithine family transaminase [Phycisphaeraceae bacterium]
MTATSDIIERHDRFMSNNYARMAVAMARGKGVQLWDADGREYLDLFAGFGGPLLGHCHDELIAALNQQAHKLWHVGNLLHTEPQTLLAQTLSRVAYPGRSFFCHSGADANEAAIKLARLHGKGKRFKVISALMSFHGRTFATMKATGQPKVSQLFEPLAPGFAHVPYNDIAALEKAIDDQTAAVLLEPIQGEAGVIVPDDDYLPRVRALCDRHDLLMMMDEVWTGCGRTGKAFCHQHSGITPDVMTLAKGAGGGLPVGVCHIAQKRAALFDWRTHGMAVHATTLGGNCLGMAVAAEIWRIIERDGLIAHAAAMGDMAKQKLQAANLPGVKQVRGKGMFIGIELTEPKAGDVVKKALAAGLLVNAAQGNVIRLAPALIIDEPTWRHGLDQLIELMR